MFKKKPFVRKYRQSENFVGFRRQPLNVFGHKPSEKGCAALLGKDLAGARIVISEINMENSVSNSSAFGVSVNGKHVGALFASSFFQYFRDDMVEAVHVRIETETVIHTKKTLFGEKAVPTERAHSVLFVKVKS